MSIDPDDNDLAYRQPAVHANRFYVNCGPDGFRITEQNTGSAPNMRCAIMMTAANAKELRDLIDQMLPKENTT